MIRFAGLQARVQLLTGAACLLVVAIVTAATGPHLSHLYHADVVPCAANGDCSLQMQALFSHDSFLQAAFNLVIRLVPAVIGIFWGAPVFARELEAGTFRLAWTQSVSRSRWVITKLVIGGLASTLAAGMFSLIVTWWFRSLDLANGNLHSFSIFDQRDLVAAGYGLFAFAAGALLGAVLRRVLPAMAATLGVFAFARVAIAAWVRPHYISALHQNTSLLGGSFGLMMYNGSGPTFVVQPQVAANGWVPHNQIVNSAGQPVSAAARAAFLQSHCQAVLQSLPGPGSQGGIAPGIHTNVGPPADAVHQCLVQAASLYHVVVTYQPSSRFWPFQWIETGLFGALALAAFGACYWWVKRRIA